MEVLIKANKKEESPYKSINQYIDKLEKYANEIVSILLTNVSRSLDLKMEKALDDDAPLIFKGRIQYDPKSGKAITKKQWKALENAIIKYLGIESDALQRKVVNDSFWLGSVINRLDESQKKEAPISEVYVSEPDFKTVNFSDYEFNEMLIAEQTAGIYLQNATQRTKNKVQEIILNGIKHNKNKSEVFQDLWDMEEDLNRDWQRVVQTETANNINNGYLLTTLSASDEEYVFMKGVSAPNACKHCKRLVSDKVVVLLNEAPEDGDKITVNGKEYSAMWPGKTNVGRRAADYWVAPIIHPHDRCTWTEWYPELEDYLND